MAKHEGFCCSQSGFVLCEQHPYFRASPDALEECVCCGKGIAEVKCPFNFKDSDIHTIVKATDSCLDDNMDMKLVMPITAKFNSSCWLQAEIMQISFCGPLWGVQRPEFQLTMTGRAEVPLLRDFWLNHFVPALTQTTKESDNSDQVPSTAPAGRSMMAR